jgi:hypothetical protein
MMGPRAGNLARGFILITACHLLATDAQAAEAVEQVDAAAGTTVATERPRHPRENTYMKRQWGVEVVFVRQTANGSMLEFRYKVIDADKAAPLHERATKPVLIHEETGSRMIVPTPPTTGALRNSNMPVAGRTYWMFFANPAKFVQPGDRVTIEIGEFVAEGLVVR